MKKDYYLILRLTPEATEREIRSAYRRLAIELHPDRSGLNSDPFLELQEAYSVLSDPTRRAVYDREAQEVQIQRPAVASRTGSSFRRRHAAEPFAPIPPEEISGPQTFHPSFDRLWSNFAPVARPKAERLENLTVDVPLSPQRAFAGGQIRIVVPVREICRACSGRQAVGFYQCWHCEGRGTIMDRYPIMVSYPAGLQKDYTVHLSFDRLGTEDFCLTVRFRPTERIW